MATTTNTATSPAKPEVKLNPYEKVILDEMERRANGEDGDMPDSLLADALKSPDKNIHECFSYITAQARKKATGNCAMIEDAIVYGWAHHYYIEPKSVIDAELKPAPKAKTTEKAETKAKDETKKTFVNPLLAGQANAKGKAGKKAGKKDDSEGLFAKSVEKKVKGDDGKTYVISQGLLF